MAQFEIDIPEQFIYLRKVYNINIFDLLRYYRTFARVTGKKSYIAFEQSLKLFFQCFNYKTVEYCPIMRQPSNK